MLGKELDKRSDSRSEGIESNPIIKSLCLFGIDRDSLQVVYDKNFCGYSKTFSQLSDNFTFLIDHIKFYLI